MRLPLFLIIAVAGMIALATPASATAAYPPGTTGYDISWPQCGQPFPAPPYAFGIVGATGGFAFTHNACLKAQYSWAAASGQTPSLYINMKSPAGTTIAQGDTGPAGTCASTDHRCKAYNYGYKTAQDAVSYAKTQAATNVATWWLDIETMSTWSDNKQLNTIVIQAAIDYLTAQGANIGIYSTAFQWEIIAGTFSPGLPLWVGGGANAEDARKLCATGAFAGGEVQLVQYPSGHFSANYACRPEDIDPPPASETGDARLIGGSVPAEGGFGLAIFSGGAAPGLVSATGCPVETAVFYFAVDGVFVAYIPAATVEAANAAFLAEFAEGEIPAGMPFIGKCG